MIGCSSKRRFIWTAARSTAANFIAARSPSTDYWRQLGRSAIHRLPLAGLRSRAGDIRIDEGFVSRGGRRSDRSDLRSGPRQAAGAISIISVVRRRRCPVAFLLAATAAFLFAAFVLLAPATKVAAQGGGAAPSNQVPCDAFRKNPDGSWTAIRAVTVKIGSSRVSAGANTVYGSHAINVNGVDFTAFLDDHCTASKK